MSDVRAKLAEALRGHQRNPYGQHDGWWECSCSTDEPHTPEHLADVLLSLEGVAIVALPEPEDTGSGQDGEFDAWWGHSARWSGHDVWAESGAVHTSAIHQHTPEQARYLAAVLLAAADAAEAATDA